MFSGIFAEGATNLAAWMNVVDSLGLSVRVPNLRVSGEDWVTTAVNLVRDMLCFDAANRCRISAVCERIEDLIGT